MTFPSKTHDEIGGHWRGISRSGKWVCIAAFGGRFVVVVVVVAAMDSERMVIGICGNRRVL